MVEISKADVHTTRTEGSTLPCLKETIQCQARILGVLFIVAKIICICVYSNFTWITIAILQYCHNIIRR